MWMQTSMFKGEALRRFWSKESDLCPFLDGDTLQRSTDCEGCYFFIHLSSWQFPVIVSNILKSEEEEDRGRLRKDTEDVQKLLFKEKRLKNSRLTQAAYLFSLSNQNRAGGQRQFLTAKCHLEVKWDLLKSKHSLKRVKPLPQ